MEEWSGERLKKVLTYIHQKNPKAIFLLQMPAIHPGFVAKEAYKKAYPESPLPKFLTINVKSLRKLKHDIQGSSSEEVKDLEKKFYEEAPKTEEEIVRKIKSLNIGDGDTILVLDEISDSLWPTTTSDKPRFGQTSLSLAGGCCFKGNEKFRKEYHYGAVLL